MKDPFLVLGVSNAATKEEIEEKYKELKEKYSLDRFLPGEEGNTAAKNLTELELAYKAIVDFKEKEEAKREYGSDYGVIDKLIKDGRYDEAQHRLDAITTRPAEWHYLQSIIFYKREWITESRAQLQIAVNSEPWNEKYKSALEKMDIIIGNPKIDPTTIGRDPNAPPPPVSDGQVCANSCSNCCMAYCLADCCCSMSQCC